MQPQRRPTASTTQDAKSGTTPPVRYTVLEVHDSAEERVLRLLDEASGAELAAHLRDSWQGTPARVGDAVHVLARIDDLGDGGRHALCDHSQGNGAAGAAAMRVPGLLAPQSMLRPCSGTARPHRCAMAGNP